MHPARSLLLVLLSGCPLYPLGGSPGGGEIRAERIAFTPCVRAEDGKTLVTVQFIAWDEEGHPLGADEVAYELIEDGVPLDTESLLDASAEELAASLDLWLVLDTSYSMVAGGVFGEMLAAASELPTKVAAAWAAHPGAFTWHVSWFAEHLSVGTGVWQPEDVLTLPEPAPGTATKLFAAVEQAADEMDDALALGVAAGDRDRRVMVVFSDGRDNYSWWDNAGWSSSGTTSGGASFLELGWPPTTLADAVSAIGADPGREVYALGLGDGLDATEDELSALTEGHGVYYYDAADVDALFEKALDQLTTLQTIGALVPLPPGDHTFETRVHLGALDGPSDSFRDEVHTADVPLCAPAP